LKQNFSSGRKIKWPFSGVGFPGVTDWVGASTKNRNIFTILRLIWLKLLKMIGFLQYFFSAVSCKNSAPALMLAQIKESGVNF